MLAKAAARKLSIPDLFHILDEKLSEERSRPLSLASLETEIKTLEARAQGIQKLLRTLRDMSRSMLPPINGLPSEIISYIARCVLEDEDVDATPIIPLTHVCRYWRDSIVSTPKNWALVYSGRMELAKLSLQRAKAVPLTIHLDLDGSKRKRGFLDLLLPHFQNTASFTCINFSKIGDLTQLLNFPKSMPHLRSLSLTRPRHADQSQPIDQFDLSTCTALRELSLYNIPLVPSILSLRTLTKFSLFDHNLQLHIDILLKFLEENRSLESASLTIRFAENFLCHSQRQAPVGSKLQHLSISSDDSRNIRALISGIALGRGGALEIHHAGNNAGFTGIFSGVSVTHLPNLSSATAMEYGPFPRSIRLLGPDGSFSYKAPVNTESSFGEFPLLPLANIRELRLECRGSWILRQFRLSAFPSLEILAVDGGSKVSLLSPVLPDPPSSPPLKTLAFLNCVVTQDFIAQLAQFSLDRTKDTCTSLRRVLIIDSEGEFPAAASIEQLRRHIPIVEVSEGREFPKDLS